MDLLTTTRPRRAHAIAALLTTTVLLGGCGGDDAAPDADGRSNPAADVRSAPPMRARPGALAPVPSHETLAGAPNRGNVSDAFPGERHALETRIAENAADTTAILALAHLLHDAHMESEAVEYYGRYVELRPVNRQAWLDLATVQASTGDWAGAKASTEALLEQYPGDPSGTYNLGAILANTGDAVGAVEIWQRVVEQSRDTLLAQMAASSIRRLRGPGR